MKIYTLLGLVFATLALAACGGGGGSESDPDSDPQQPPAVFAPSGDTVELGGTVTYDLVPYQTDAIGLDYNAITVEPAKGVTVELLDADGRVLTRENTDQNGDYTFTVSAQTVYAVRVVAELLGPGNTPQWQFRVADNTSENALYVLEGSMTTSGTSDSRRDLHAASGWTGSAYTQTRSAAPFAILDTVYLALQQLLAVDSTLSFSPLEFRWSERNSAVDGNLSEGHITTSFFDPSRNHIYLLGSENADTDEYDRSVVLHEFAHYLESDLSRSDSIGGQHAPTWVIDMRLAYSEGLANALAGIWSGMDTYIDTKDRTQVGGFRYDLEGSTNTQPGWFSEGSLTRLIYDTYDENADGADQLNLGLGPLLEVLFSPDYVNHPSLTSVYTFAEVLSEQNPSALSGVRAMLESESIFGTDAFASNESNNAGISYTLPIFHDLAVGQTLPITTNNSLGDYVGLDVRRFVRFNITEAGTYRFTLETSACSTGIRFPTMILYKNGIEFTRTNGRDANLVRTTQVLEEGLYILEVFDRLNVDFLSDTGGPACFDLTLDS